MILGVNPYLIFNGNGKEAITFYENALDAKVETIQTFEEIPENPEFPIPDEAKNRVLHALLKIGNSEVMISDTLPGHDYQIGSNLSIAIMISNVEKTKEVFKKLEDGGNVEMPVQETFWSPAYGQVTDKFGVSWQLSTQSVGNK